MNLFNTADVDAAIDAARQDAIEAAIGTDWFEREQAGVRFLSERDFPIDVDVDGPTDADWDFFAETMYVDPAERNF